MRKRKKPPSRGGKVQSFFKSCLHFQPLFLIKDRFAEAYALGRDFDQFVVGDEFKTLFERKRARSDQFERVLAACGAVVGQLLFLAYVDDEIVFARVFSDDHPSVHGYAGPDEQSGAFLCVEKTVCGRDPVLERYHRAAAALLDVAFVRFVSFEYVGHYAEAARIRKHFAAVAYKTARGYRERKTGAATVVGGHVLQLAFTGAQFVHYRAHVCVGNVDDDGLDRFAFNAVDLLEYDFGARYLEFVTFAAHRFYEYGKMKFASAEHAETFGGIGLFDPHTDVGLHFAEQSCAQMSAGDELAFLARERRVVDHEVHRQGRFVYRDEGQRFGAVGIAYGLADIEILHSAERNDVADGAFVRFDAFEPFELVQLYDFFVRDRAVGMAYCGKLSASYRAADDLADADPADVIVIVNVADYGLQS